MRAPKLFNIPRRNTLSSKPPSCAWTWFIRPGSTNNCATASGEYGAPIATMPKTATSNVVKGLENRTTYFFVITAYDVAGNESDYSNEVSRSIV